MITFEYPYLVFLIFLPFIIRYLLPTVKGLYGDALKVPFVQDFTNIENKEGLQIKKNSADTQLSLRWWTVFLIWLFLVVALMRPCVMGDPIRVEGI